VRQDALRWWPCSPPRSHHPLSTIPKPSPNAISHLDCTARYLVDHHTEAYCREIGDVFTSQECSYRVAVEAGRVEWCDFVVLPAKRRDCFARFGLDGGAPTTP